MDAEGMQTKVSKQNDGARGVLSQVIPFVGCISYELFSANIMHPKKFSALIGQRDIVVADCLWLNAHIGLGLYLYTRRTFQKIPTAWRITYSAFGSGLFNFGSVLMWGTTKALMPKIAEELRVVFGFGSGAILLYIGWKYLQQIDALVEQSEETKDLQYETTSETSE